KCDLCVVPDQVPGEASATRHPTDPSTADDHVAIVGSDEACDVRRFVDVPVPRIQVPGPMPAAEKLELQAQVAGEVSILIDRRARIEANELVVRSASVEVKLDRAGKRLRSRSFLHTRFARAERKARRDAESKSVFWSAGIGGFHR